ncbi:hypothetical protein ACFYYN_43055 [Streptomyces sp. NPDC001902]
MESEVLAALIATPTVLVTAAAAWAAGRAQSRGTYHGAVDAVRREGQRQAYADLYRAANQFMRTWEAADEALMIMGPAREGMETPEEVRALFPPLVKAHYLVEQAADMVRLEGPEDLARLAERLWRSTSDLVGRKLGPGMGTTVALLSANMVAPEMLSARTKALAEFKDAHTALLPTARKYLNGGPSA